MLKNILQFYLTLAIPFLYLFILYTIATTPHTFTLEILNSPLTQIIFLVTALFGAILWILSYLHLKNSFGVLPTTKSRITSGLYHYFPHPMYLGIFLLFNGLALTTLSLPGFLSNLLILTPINIFRAHKETQQLHQ